MYTVYICAYYSLFEKIISGVSSKMSMKQKKQHIYVLCTLDVGHYFSGNQEFELCGNPLK